MEAILSRAQSVKMDTPSLGAAFFNKGCLYEVQIYISKPASSYFIVK